MPDLISERARAAVIEYANAFRAAEKNTGDMATGRANVDAARRGMDRLDAAQRALWDLFITDRPVAVQQFIEANIDQGCARCWMSSSGPIHDECGSKIKRWFECRDALVSLGLRLSGEGASSTLPG